MSSAIIEITSKGFGCVGVTCSKKGELIGIITDGDLRRYMNPDLLKKKVREIMTNKPLTLNKNSFIRESLEFMNKEKITNCFITDKKKPIGILHMHDILRY